MKRTALSVPHLRRILVVEDEPDMRRITRLALVAGGDYAVKLCASGPEALAAVPKFHPDMILLDAMLPTMDGPHALEKLRQNPETAAIPVVFFTAKAQPHEIARFRELGALDVICKPFDPLTLGARLLSLWKRHHQSLLRRENRHAR